MWKISGKSLWQSHVGIIWLPLCRYKELSPPTSLGKMLVANQLIRWQQLNAFLHVDGVKTTY